MAPSAQQRAFLAFAGDARPLLSGCALLLVGEPGRAARLTGTVLARRYADALETPAPLTAALRELVRPQPAYFRPPWHRDRGLELVDGGPGPRPATLLEELQQLPREQRAALVLRRYGGLDPALVAGGLRTDVATVEHGAQQAVATLSRTRPDRLQPGRLDDELRAAAVPAVPPDEAAAAARDLQHGRQLVRRRRLGRSSAAVVALLVVLVGAATFLRAAPSTPEAASTPVPIPTSTASPVPRVAARCDIRNPVCQATVMREWRAEMARVAASYVDPEGRYFTGYSFSYDQRYETTSFWEGRGGALGLEMFRLTDGSTEVYVQVASGYDTAVRCGQVTRRPCESMRFMDGNRFTLTSTTEVEQGIEVQHRPDGDQVITVVARNTTRGRALDVTRGDLIALVQDPRLRLPLI